MFENPELDITIRRPEIINLKMIEAAVLRDKKNGESTQIDLLNLNEINLEINNILKIDYLWTMPNLKELSLSLNCIEKIENLEVLKNLTDLSLSFNSIEKIENLSELKQLQHLSLNSNKIQIIENLNSLENLISLNLANNLIEKIDGLEELRLLPNLRILNLEGNPVTKNFESFRIFIAGLLPKLKFFDNSCIRDEEKVEGLNNFKTTIAELTKNEDIIIKERNKERKFNLLLPTFVESLDENQLYDSLFENDIDGDILRMINTPTIEELNLQYRNDIYTLTQNIYKIGIEKYRKRLKEIEIYEEFVDSTLEKVNKPGRRILDIYTKISEDIQNIPTSSSKFSIENEEIKTMKLQFTKKFNSKLNKITRDLITNEINLYTTIKNATLKFGSILKEIINSLRWETQTFFIQLRDVINNYADNVQSAVTQYFYKMIDSGRRDDIPNKLKDLLDDDNLFANSVYYMKYNHLEKIDDRESKLITRAETFVRELIDKKEKDNADDHKKRILKILYFKSQYQVV